MTHSFNDARQQILDDLENRDPTTEEYTTGVKNLKTLAEAQTTYFPLIEEKPKGVKGFLERNSGDLIKAGGTFAAIAMIGIIETKFDVIFRSKASKYI